VFPLNALFKFEVKEGISAIFMRVKSGNNRRHKHVDEEEALIAWDGEVDALTSA
jgi:hypothetical protein